MNFINALAELDKLYESIKTENLKEAINVKTYSKSEAETIINADRDLLAEYEELLPYYEAGDLDHSFEYGNFFNLIEDPSKVVIQWVDTEDTNRELIVDSLEAAVVIIRDIEDAYENVEEGLIGAVKGAASGFVSGLKEDTADSLEEVEEGILDAVKGAASGFVAGLKEDTDEDVEIEIEDDEAVAKQVIYECNNCGALVIKDEGEEVDPEEECAYCGEAKGFKAIGTFEAYEAEEEPVEEAPVEDEELPEDETVDESLDTEEAELEEGIFDSKATKQKKYEELIKAVFKDPFATVKYNAAKLCVGAARTYTEDKADVSSAKRLINTLQGIKRGDNVVNKVLNTCISGHGSDLSITKLKDFCSKMEAVKQATDNGKEAQKAYEYLVAELNSFVTAELDKFVARLKKDYRL